MAATGQTLPAGGNLGNPSPVHRFLTAQPKALGMVQIMIGLVTFMFGIVLVAVPPFVPYSVASGYVFWASVFYIVAGSLSVVAEIKLHPSFVQAVWGMNIPSAIFSVIGIGVLSGDLTLHYICFPSEHCSSFEARTKAISGVLLFFTIVQVIISIWILVFAYKVTGWRGLMATNTNTQMPVVTYDNQVAPGNP